MMVKYSGQASCIDAMNGFSADGYYAQAGDLTSSYSNFFNQLANQSQCEQALLFKLIKTDELAYTIEQNLSPFCTELGNFIYPFLTNGYGNAGYVDLYEFSVFQQRLKCLVRDMGLTQYYWKRVPINRHHAYAVDEMSLANALVIELRKYLLSRGYKADLANRKTISAKLLSSMKSLLSKLQDSTEGVFLRRFDFYENTGSVPVSLEDTGSRWSKFLQKLTPWMIDYSHLGYIWRRELIPEVGFRYHLILCCHVDSARGEPIENILLPAWQRCTTNLHAKIHLPNGHRGNGNYEIASRHAPDVLMKVVDSVRMMLDGERICRLRSVNGMPNWGSQDLRSVQKKQVAQGGYHG